MAAKSSYPWFVRKGLDGLFGLAIDNLIQLFLRFYVQHFSQEKQEKILTRINL